MSHVCCTVCRLRFPAPEAAYILVCPDCGNPPLVISDLRHSVGFRLHTPELAAALPQALPIALPVAEPDEWWS